MIFLISAIILIVNIFIYFSFFILTVLTDLFIYFIAVPGAPIDLRAPRVGQNFIELEWKEPKSDGGTPISKYCVFISQFKPDNWTKLASTGAYDTYHKAANLEEDMDYYFMVYAENKIGKGQAVTTEKPITTKRGLRKS